jgi:hypothetical protein
MAPNRAEGKAMLSGAERKARYNARGDSAATPRKSPA